MGYCPCFGLLRGKKLKSDDKKKHHHPSNYNHATKRDMRDMSHPTKDGCNNTPNMASTISYQELAIATNDFNQEALIGRGGFGAVFKGKLSTGQAVAVKQLDQTGIQGEKEFLVEVLMLSLLHHPHLVKLIGYCGEGTQRLLVYEYMPLGSLDDHLFDVTSEMKPLDWNTRMKIAAGTARGLKSLHCADPPVIYRDLKASNILLDEGFHPKLSDFGLAKFGPSGDLSHVSTRVMGTYGYCAPEYASTGKLTMKTDIYSYGIVLLELITGRRAVDEINGHHKHLTSWALPLMKNRGSFSQLADPLLRGGFSMSVLSKAIEVASMCLNENASLRPSATDLVQAMDYLESRKYHQEKDSNYKEVSSETLDKDLDRDKAVAEAKMWGETWRDKKIQGGSRNVSEDNYSMDNEDVGSAEQNQVPTLDSSKVERISTFQGILDTTQASSY